MSKTDINVTVTVEALGALHGMLDVVRRKLRDWIVLDMDVMRRRHGPIRYLMPRWWRLRRQLAAIKRPEQPSP